PVDGRRIDFPSTGFGFGSHSAFDRMRSQETLMTSLFGSARRLNSTGRTIAGPRKLLMIKARRKHWRATAGRVKTALITTLVLAGAGQAFAQAPEQPLPLAGFQDGFFVQSANGDNRLLFGLVAQTDGRFSVDDPTPIINSFVIRKVRPTFSGRVARYF